MKPPAKRRLALVLGLPAILVLATGVAYAQGPFHQPHLEEGVLTQREVLAGIVHGAALAATVFLAGLAAFAALVWLPASREVGAGREVVRLFVRWAWGLLGLLVIAGLTEVSLYAVRASGEPFGPGLLGEALFDTRVGNVWLARLGFGLLTTVAATVAAAWRSPAFWWGAVGFGSVLLMTLTQLSHAAAEGGFLPFFADWLHVIAASVWMGGLLGFPVLLIGPLRAMPQEGKTELLAKTVRRFSRVATVAVMTLIVTGAYAVLLHVPSVSAIILTPYGRALIMKLGLLVFLLAAGGLNFMLQGKKPFDRMVGAELVLAFGVFVATGFLTSLPPADAVAP